MKKIKILTTSIITLIFTIFMFFSFNSSAKTLTSADGRSPFEENEFFYSGYINYDPSQESGVCSSFEDKDEMYVRDGINLKSISYYIVRELSNFDYADSVSFTFSFRNDIDTRNLIIDLSRIKYVSSITFFGIHPDENVEISHFENYKVSISEDITYLKAIRVVIIDDKSFEECDESVLLAYYGTQEKTTYTYTVKNKSVVCTEAHVFLHRRNYWWGLDKSNAFILLRNKETNELIKNLKSMQIEFKIDGDKQYRSTIAENLGDRNVHTFGSVFSDNGMLTNTTDENIDFFKSEVIPNMDTKYQFSDYPQYVWSWNKDVIEVKTVYVWYEVEAGTTVQGSCYDNGMHVEYDYNGKVLGVFDKDGNKVDGFKATADGRVETETGDYVNPDNSVLEYNEIVPVPFPLTPGDDSTDNTLIDGITKILSLGLGIAGLIAVCYLIAMLLKLLNFLPAKKSYKKYKRKK